MFEMSKVLAARDDELKETKEQLERYKKLSDKKLLEIDKKLIRWRAKAEFPSQQEYYSYVKTMLDKWDNRFGRVFVYVSAPKGKTASFVNRIGEPVKWNTNLCWVKWLGGN